jgi:anti-sigma regulatory factor (Ser/Thr protein kinase)
MDPAVPTGDDVQISLPNDSTAPGQARQAVTATLTRWHLSYLSDSCMLAVSELVTNAVQHGRPPIGMFLRRGALAIRLDVHDGDPKPISEMHGGGTLDLLESGRGLEVVQAISDDCGSEHIPGDGKTVFASWHVNSR